MAFCSEVCASGSGGDSSGSEVSCKISLLSSGTKVG